MKKLKKKKKKLLFFILKKKKKIKKYSDTVNVEKVKNIIFNEKKNKIK